MRPGEIGEVPGSPAVRELEAPVVAIFQLPHFTQTSWAGPPELVLSCPYPLQARPDKACHYVPGGRQLVERAAVSVVLVLHVAMNTAWICGSTGSPPPWWVLSTL